MAGDAKTSQFLLSTATLMIGPSTKVMELSPSLHSIGLVKNVQVTTTPKFVELTQGVNAQVVFTVNTDMASKVTAEVFEYTGANLAYAGGLDGSNASYAAPAATTTLASAITVGGTSVVLATGGVTAAGITAGGFVVICEVTTGDRLHVGKVASIATDTLTLATGYAMPTTMAFTVANTVVYRVNPILVGSQTSNPTFGVKLVGNMPGDGTPVTLIFPKVKIVKGLDLNFQTNDFTNMPFEFQPYALLPTDPYYGDFSSTKSFGIFSAV